jgi:hypothetical protein
LGILPREECRLRQGKIPVERRRSNATRAKGSGCAEERLQSMVRASAKETLASVHRYHDRGHARPADPGGPMKAEHPPRGSADARTWMVSRRTACIGGRHTLLRNASNPDSDRG